MKKYQLVSPSLAGIMCSEAMIFDGIRRPSTLAHILDGKDSGRKEISEVEIKLLQEYFYDLYGVFMKKLSHFVVEHRIDHSENVKIVAMLQEMIRVKEMMQ